MYTYMFIYTFAGTLPSMQSGLSWRGHLYSSGRIQDVAGCGPRAEDSWRRSLKSSSGTVWNGNQNDPKCKGSKIQLDWYSWEFKLPLQFWYIHCTCNCYWYSFIFYREKTYLRKSVREWLSLRRWSIIVMRPLEQQPTTSWICTMGTRYCLFLWTLDH